MLIFDIGANVGSYAIANQADNRIICVEASPSTYDILKSKVSAYSNITHLHYAVTKDTSEFVTFYHCKAANTISTLNKDWLSSPDSRFGYMKNDIVEYKVPTVSIDKLIDLYGMPDLVKVDVEGAEHIVLPSLSKKVPVLCFEWAAEWKSQNMECIWHLMSLGFKQFHVQNRDEYTYRPRAYELNEYDVFDVLEKAKPKEDWGMVWAM